ncbi:MAG: WbqC family protein [Parcubacteria group bacterium]|nr:WbqC family protein [Parcubacteria group bacterium]
MKIVIHQPEYLPWLGFFDKLTTCDLYVALDHVQYQRGFINRNRIKTPHGTHWLTVPIMHKFHRSSINTVLINNQTDWKREHLLTLQHNYANAPFFKKHADFFTETFSRDWQNISDLDMHLMQYLMSMLDIAVPIQKSSELGVEGKSTELLITICKKVNADFYLSGEGGKNYMDLKRFEEEGIAVEFQDFNHPVYEQQFPQDGFAPNMSIVDLLFNCGPKSREILSQTL